jgi:RNA polymerase sigma-70 factor (ECF subfamily)
MNDFEFTRIYEKYAATVYQIAFLDVGNSAEAEDIMQETFIKLLHHKAEFANDEHCKAWLITVAHNAGKDLLKSFWRRHRVGENALLELPAAEDEAVPEVLAAVMKLTPKYRVVVYLYYYVGYATAEIADMLHLNHSTVRSQLSKARKELALLIGEEA